MATKIPSSVKKVKDSSMLKKVDKPNPSPSRKSGSNGSTIVKTGSGNDDDLRETIARLESELSVERASRQKKIHALQVQLDQEHARSSVAVKDVRAKLLAERSRELDLQREALQRKHDNEMSKVVKQREAEVNKIKAELTKCSTQLKEMNNNGGLSHNQRHAFEAERSRLVADMQELRGQKRRLEDLVRTAQDAEKQMAGELRQAHELQKTEAARIRRDADIEVKKLLEELKSKDRLITSMEKDSGAAQAKETIAKQQNMILTLATEMAVWENEKRGQTMSMSMESNDSAISTDSSGVIAEDPTAIEEHSKNPGQPPPNGPGNPPPDGNSLKENPQIETASEPTERKTPPRQQQADGDQSESSYQAMTELRVKLRKTEDAVTNLTQDKVDLMKRIKDLEKKFKQSQEKNRKFLEKNMDLTNINRNLEEKIRKLTEDNSKLKSNVEKSKKEMSRLNNRLSNDKQGKDNLDQLQEELQSYKQQNEDQNKNIEALKLACAEKDRRIELLAHRRKKQRATKQQQKVVRFTLPGSEHDPGAAGLKETYYGYDEDSKSLDSENLSLSSSRMSSSRVSLDNSPEYDDASDEVFDEFTREEFEKNYQRLAKEHLELEKSFAMLQSQNGSSHTDPQREQKMRSQLESDLLDAQTKIEDLKKKVPTATLR